MKHMNKNGFTLIELLVSIAILAVLTLIALPAITRTQSSAETKKFSTYEQVLLNGAKLYVDSNKEDLWGRNETGCLKISYSKLKLSSLIKEFNGKDIDCSNDAETFIFVTKTGEKYDYKSSLVCRKQGKIVYSNKAETDDNCTNAPDKQPPVINANPNTSDYIISSKLEEKLKVEINDDSNLMANASFKYKWISDDNDTSSDGYQSVSITNYKTNTTKKILTNVKVPNTLNGTYYLKIIPISICDISSQCQSNVYISGAYKISNKPATPTISNPSGGKWTNKNINLTVSTTTPDSQIGYWYHSFDNQTFVKFNKEGFNSYGKSTFETSPYASNKNDLVYIRVCNKGATSANDTINCSNSASTWIKIDKTKPTISYALINDKTGARHYSGNWSRNGLFRYLYPADSGGSGINTTQYNSGGGWKTEDNLTKYWLDQRNENVSFRVRDNAGNYSDTLKLHIMIDWTAPQYTVVRRVCGGVNGQTYKFWIDMSYEDRMSGLGYRYVKWYTTSWHDSGTPDLNSTVGGEAIGTWGNFISFYHTICDHAGNCNQWNDGGVNSNGC